MKNKITSFLLAAIAMITLATPVLAQDSVQYPEYIVQTGDTINGIALLFDINAEQLTQANNITDPNTIYPGLHLLIPAFPGIGGVLTPISLDLGENWRTILIRYQVDETTLLKLNPIILPSGLVVGNQLIVPVKTESSELIPQAMMSEDSLFLENSVLLDENPYQLLLRNNRASEYTLFSGDPVYGNTPSGPKINPISAALDSVKITPLPLVQGVTVSVQVTSKIPMTLHGTLDGNPLLFYTEDNLHHFALQGINAMSLPGLTVFSLSGGDQSSEIFSFQQNLVLVNGNFDTDPSLTVDPSLIDPNFTIPELEKIKSYTTVFTPQKYWNGIFLSPDNDYGKVIPNYEQRRELTSYFGSRRTYNDNPEVSFHTGIDFGGGEGLPIVSPAAGKVVFAGNLPIRGNVTIIDHGLGVFSAFFHQSQIKVQTGQMVERGQEIGTVGNTGRVDRANEYEGAGAHLHWEIWVNGNQVNPLDWLNQEYP